MLRSSLTIIHEGPPRAKGRARYGQGRTYTPTKTRKAEADLRTSAQRAMSGWPLMLGPLALELSIAVAIPKSWSKWKREQARSGYLRPVTKPDWDNLGKIVSDACNGVVWVDDSQVVDAHVRKFYSEHPHVHLYVRRLEISPPAHLPREQHSGPAADPAPRSASGSLPGAVHQSETAG